MPNKKKYKVYLDNCCFNRPYDDQSEPRVSLESHAKMLIQDMIREGKLNLVTSSVLDFEISRCPYKDRKTAIEQFLENYSSEYVWADLDEEIEAEADAIMSSGVKFYDAQHVACAIHSGCDYFLSTDRRLLKYQTEKINIINPIDFIGEMEKNDE